MKNLLHDITRHLAHYLSLFAIAVAVVLGLTIFAYNQTLEIIIIVGAGIAFVVWGIVHHLLHEDLHLKIIIEYVSVALLGVTLALSVIL